MIIASVIGGLGNQMFQYATARALSLRQQVPLSLDLSQFDGYALHQGFELSKVFGLECSLSGAQEARRLLGWRTHSLVRRMLRRAPRLANQEFLIEPHFQYWPALDSAGPDCYLSGYWQSERYFVDKASQIRKDFTFQEPLGKENARIAEKTRLLRSVSLHVRRGDYANDPKTTATHGLCSLAYYAQALRYVQERVPDLHLFVFSDDINWVRNGLPLANVAHTYVQNNQGTSSWKDMQLMSLCQHHIIANSSFSWWGAWLNPRPNKIVIAPRQWFAIPVNTTDLIPPQWVRL